MKPNFIFRLTLALSWLICIYTFLPFGPNVYNLIAGKLGATYTKIFLVAVTICGALIVYVPFVKKFKAKRVAPYAIITTVLIIVCAINISLKPAARTLHIPEYLILSLLLFNAFRAKFSIFITYISTAAAGITAGIVDERVIQYLLPMRYYDTTDILLNTAGIAAGIFLISAYRLEAT